MTRIRKLVTTRNRIRTVLALAAVAMVVLILPAAALSHKLPPRMEPVNLMTYKVNNWLDCSISADCKTGRYTLKVNGREVLKDAGFAEPSSMVYALSFRTGEYRGKPTGRADQDIPNTEEPLEKVTYRIDDVMTGK